MIEALAGTGLAAAAGLNAYIPLLALGLLGRFTDIVSLPSGWSWLENPWVLGVFGALLLLEVVADKIPAVDHLNDLAQTLVRPAAGGIVFGSGTAAETPAVSDPGALFSSGSWVPIATGVVVALVVHLIKAAVRAAANAAFAGVGAPVLSTAEDGLSVILVAAAILFPILVLVALAGAVVFVVLLIRRWRRRAAGRRPSMGVASSTPGT